MSFFESILLGLIQGITEFLPISSSGHLVIAQNLLGFSQPPIFFDTMLHLATLSAVIIYFRKSLGKYLTSSNLVKIIVASIPAAIAGILISPHLESVFSSLIVVGSGLIITGILMLLTRSITKSDSVQITTKKAIFIGMFQAAAILPGISRSGSTIFGGLINKVSKKTAFEFSFILSIPTILGAVALQVFSTQVNSFPIENLAGFIAAFLSGLIAIKILDYVINQEKLHYFGYYCLILGLASLIVAV
jgi:undecaprenyl-diphosphatase